jgi:hypothetical protein
MAIAFTIMQIGNPELERLYYEAIVPAVEACGLDAKRVDKHNEGGILKSEIIKFIQNADIIIADLTNEHPNCYLEIGYAMGIDKYANLILTVREDHFSDKPSYVQGGPKVHFDLAAYPILDWKLEEFQIFREALEREIKRRLAIIATAQPKTTTPWDEVWILIQREAARNGLAELGFNGSMEIRFSLGEKTMNWGPGDLDEAARKSTINTFGWPIGVYLNTDEYRPKPRSDGIFAEVKSREGFSGPSYDYWTINRSGDFFSLSSFFEDCSTAGKLFVDTRIVRATEALMYCARLYSRLNVEQSSTVHFALRFDGLSGRTLAVANPLRSSPRRRPCDEDDVDTVITTTLQGIEDNLVELVKDLLSQLFILFDFLEVSDGVYEEIVNKFVRGEVA